MTTIDKLIRMIKELSASELLELNKRLSSEGIPPLGAGVPAQPKPFPPSLNQEAVIGTDIEGNQLVKRPYRD